MRFLCACVASAAYCALAHLQTHLHASPTRYHQARTWVELLPSGRAPPPRFSHCLHHHGEYVFLYGGVNDLGATSDSMFKVQMPYESTWSTFKPHWAELDSDVDYNPARAALFCGDKICLVQVGVDGALPLGRSGKCSPTPETAAAALQEQTRTITRWLISTEVAFNSETQL